MTPKNKNKLWSEILLAGDFLKDKLPNHPNHTKGRNSYAHVALEIKNKFKMSYKDLPDDQYDNVLDFLNLDRSWFLHLVRDKIMDSAPLHEDQMLPQ